MTKSNPIDYLENSGIRVTPCCDRAIAAVQQENFSTMEPARSSQGVVWCPQCNKPYNITLTDSLITSITPIEDAIA